MKANYSEAVKIVLENERVFALDSINGLDMRNNQGEIKMYSSQVDGVIEAIPVNSTLGEWELFAPLGYKLDRTGEDRCYTLPGAKSIPKTLVTSEEDKAIQEDLARIEKNKKIHPFGYDGKVVFEFDTEEKLRSDINMSLKRRIELGEDKTSTFQKVQAIWITPAEPEGIKPELIYTDKDGFI